MRLFACATALALAVMVQPAAAQTPIAPPDATDPAAAADPVADEADLPVTRDRFENINRAVWGFNQGLDKVVVKPVTTVYRTVTPRPARRGISKIFANLGEPWSFVNNLLQGKVGRAFNNLGRFVVNTTIGVGGLADHATDLGLKPTPEDFGQTLAVWGVKNSAYIVLPLLGPSTVRDGIGSGVAMVADPYNICLRECTNLTWTQRLGVQAAEVVSIRSDLIDSGADAFLATSLDSYAAARSAYLQNRAQAIADTEGSDEAVGAEDPASLDPTAADAPPPAETPSATTPPAPAAPSSAEPAPSAPDPASPKLSFNLDPIQG